MLRISSIGRSNGAVALRLEGRVLGPWVEELRRSSDEVLDAGGTLTLDLTDVSFIDGGGIALLKNLMGLGVPVVNCSAFVAAQLKGEDR